MVNTAKTTLIIGFLIYGMVIAEKRRGFESPSTAAASYGVPSS